MVWRVLRNGRLGRRGGKGSQPTIGNGQVEACPLPVFDGGLAVAGWRGAFSAVLGNAYRKGRCGVSLQYGYSAAFAGALRGVPARMGSAPHRRREGKVFSLGILDPEKNRRRSLQIKMEIQTK